MNWEQCKNLGVVTIMPNGNVRLYYDQWNFCLIVNPVGLSAVDSANWQGNNLILKGRDCYGNPMIFAVSSLYNYQRIA